MQTRIPTFLKIIGVVFTILGVVAAYYGPLEIFVFYMFSEGGRFYYDGFGMGSFWFAALVVQNIAYYFVAALFIPVGIGHFKLRRWALTLTQLYLWFWLSAGSLIFSNFLWLIRSVFRPEADQNISNPHLSAIGLSLFLFLVGMPLLALAFYRSHPVKSAFEDSDFHHYWTERYPFTLLALLLCDALLVIGLHCAAFFQGLFPFFGKILLLRPAAYLIALCVLILGFLAVGTVRLKKWAWWGSLGFALLLILSTVLTYSKYTLTDIVEMMKLPAYEMEFLNRIGFLADFNLLSLLTPPLLAVLGLILYSKRFFWNGGERRRLAH